MRRGPSLISPNAPPPSPSAPFAWAEDEAPWRPILSIALVALPVLGLLVLGYARRWVADDAFIDFRVVHQVLAGHGPVFNVDERVEAYTSPLWLGLLTLGAVAFPVEWVSVVLGLLFSAAGVVLAELGAIRLARQLDANPFDQPAIFVPLGVLVPLGVAGFWDFETSGLETGLTFGWLGLSFWLLVRQARRNPRGRQRDGTDLVAAVVFGLGTLIHPDLGIFSVAFLVALGLANLSSGGKAGGNPVAGAMRVATAGNGRSNSRENIGAAVHGRGHTHGGGHTHGRQVAPGREAPRSKDASPSRPWRMAITLVVAAGFLPGLYEIFRMGYFAALVPNTALAKEASMPKWASGWDYLHDLISIYALWIPLALIAGWTIVKVKERYAGQDWPRFLVLFATSLAAVIHALYVIRVGGDFMHARLLLPSLFGLLLPVMMVRLPTTLRDLMGLDGLRLVIVAGWCVYSGLFLRVYYPAHVTSGGISDERGYYVATAGFSNPVALSDYQNGLYDQAARAGLNQLRPAPRSLLAIFVYGEDASERDVPATLRDHVLPLREDVSRSITWVFPAPVVGLFGNVAGLDVHVEDLLGLADPIASRLRLAQPRLGRTGHEKQLGYWWVVARYSPSGLDANDPRLAEARQALACGELSDLLHAVQDPLTPGRFVRNIVSAARFTALRLPNDPAEARQQFCG